MIVKTKIKWEVDGIYDEKWSSGIGQTRQRNHIQMCIYEINRYGNTLHVIDVIDVYDLCG